ncbi:hypothetical protein Tco_1228102 [Tanacetum coccineum]
MSLIMKRIQIPKPLPDLPIKDSFLMVDEANQHILHGIIRRRFDISCDMIPPGIDTDDDSEGDVPPFEEPLDDVLFPLPKVDILPIEVEPVEVFRILEDSWFNIMEEQSNAHNFH